MTDPGDCGATGGISTRFVHILCTQPVIQGTNSVKYVPGSFNVIGNDGNHTNVSLTAAPTNNSVPAQVLNALYYMSNHLPVSIKVAVTFPVATAVTNLSFSKISFNVFPNPVNGFLRFKGSHIPGDTCKILFKNSLGQNIFEEKYGENFNTNEQES